MPLPATVLIFGHDPMLLDTRRWVLEHAGFKVFAVSNVDHAAQVVTDHPVDLFLLCHTLSSAERRTVVATASVIKPGIKKLTMTTNGQEAGLEKIEGEILHMFVGAEGLIAAARNLLEDPGAA